MVPHWLVVTYLFGMLSTVNPSMDRELFSVERRMGAISAETGEYVPFASRATCEEGDRTGFFAFDSTETENIGIFFSATYECLPVVE